MTNNIYLIIPNSYNTIYKVLLELLSKPVKNIIDDCDSICNSKDKIIFQCWFLFQSAIACKENNEENKAEFIINYIKKQLLHTFKINVDEIIIEDDDNDDIPGDDTNNNGNCDCDDWIDVDSH